MTKEMSASFSHDGRRPCQTSNQVPPVFKTDSSTLEPACLVIVITDYTRRLSGLSHNARSGFHGNRASSTHWIWGWVCTRAILDS